MLHDCIHSDPLSASWAWYIMQWPAHCTLEDSRFGDFIMSYPTNKYALSICSKNWKHPKRPKDLEAPQKTLLFPRVFPLCFLSIHHSIHVFQPNKSPSLPTKHSEGIEVPCEPYGEKGGYRTLLCLVPSKKWTSHNHTRGEQENQQKTSWK